MSHVLGAFAVFANIHVTEITWRPIGSWTRGLEPLSPPGPASDSERRRLRTMEIGCDVFLFWYLTKLFVLAWAWIFVDRNPWSEKSVMRWWPLCSLGITPLGILIVKTQIIQRKLILISTSSGHASPFGGAATVWNGSVCYLSFQFEGFGADADGVQWLVGSGPRHNWIRLIQSFVAPDSIIVDGFGEAISTCSKTVGHVTLHMIGESRCGIIWLEHSRNIVAVRRWILVYSIIEFQYDLIKWCTYFYLVLWPGPRTSHRCRSRQLEFSLLSEDCSPPAHGSSIWLSGIGLSCSFRKSTSVWLASQKHYRTSCD